MLDEIFLKAKRIAESRNKDYFSIFWKHSTNPDKGRYPFAVKSSTIVLDNNVDEQIEILRKKEENRDFLEWIDIHKDVE